MASLESTSPKFSSAFESCHNVHCTFFFLALNNTDQCIHLGTHPAHHQLAFASGRAPVSFPGSMYKFVFALEFTPIVTIVNKTLLQLRFVKLIFEEICFYRNAAILNAVLKHTECSNISFLICNI